MNLLPEHLTVVKMFKLQKLAATKICRALLNSGIMYIYYIEVFLYVVFTAIFTWNVKNVTDMQCIFAKASSFICDLSLWDVGKVTMMVGMFDMASSFHCDLSDWNAANVKSMLSMFNGAVAFNGDIS
ncbi:hypothetical protein TL16_g09914 [Triparma laevis f. inornata]|uniref:BspA family leucine-rich repeat surface protein n=1 Tax=Triparma laevis f. inornata TaxID=1714386 RepID=A0A9W7B5V2_9STRA|nr:hypothetical protein TL16_g09914 [Triparma laevis f. inornata]